MKNIINNEQMISISDLKKQAKIARKQNNELSNHSASLKAIANQHNYDSWEKLLDASYLMLSPQKPSFETGQKEQIYWENDRLLAQLSIFTNIMNNCHDEYAFLNNASGYNTIFNFFQINILSKHQLTSPIYQKLKLLIDFMISSFLEYKSDEKTFSNILNFATLRKENPLFKIKIGDNTSQKLRKYTKFNDLHIHTLPESHMLQIEDTLYMENLYNHNEVLLILNSLTDKINFMSTAYDVVEKNKKDNTFFNDWLSDYENLVSLSLYDDWIESEIKKYQRLVKGNSSSFFDTEKHNEALKYLNYYKNNKYGEITIRGTKKEVIELLKTDPQYSNNFMCNLDIEKAEIRMKIFDEDYEFIFYYIIH